MLTQEVLNYKLCYVSENWAYFTSIDLNEQWGDDWNDSPYEHNAGPPYSHSGTENHSVLKVAFSGQVDPPCASYANSHWSVEQINGGDAPWLSNQFFTSGKVDNIYAGASLAEFIDFIKRNEGDVYVPLHFVDVQKKLDTPMQVKQQHFRGEFG